LKVPLDIFSGFYESQSLPLNSQRCVNFEPIIPQAQSLNSKALFGRAGLKTFSTLIGVNRGSILANKIPYFVNGTGLFSLDSVGVYTLLGTITGVKRVVMATNTTVDGTTKIAIVVPGGDSFVYDSSLGTVVKITDPDFKVSDTVTFKDGYYTFTSSDGLTFFTSGLNDPATFDALDFGTAEIDPDLIVGQIVNHNELFVMGEETGELFQNVGGVGFPFQRIPGANIQKGLYSKYGLIAYDNSFVFIGGGKNENAAIWKISGSSSAVKISTSAIDTAIQQYTKAEIAESFAMTYSKNGNFFVTYTFESLRIPSRTFVYNATTSALSGGSVWHELQSGVTDNRWRVQSIVQAYGKLLVGDDSTATIGEIDDSTYTDYGATIYRYVTSNPFRTLDQTQFWTDLELLLEQGVGLTTGQGSDPVVRMQFSNDSGRTWSSEFPRNFGKIGEYTRRSIWRRQGRISTNRVIRFIMTDPVKSNILGCTVQDEVSQ
jgi:hypothetical protein